MTRHLGPKNSKHIKEFNSTFSHEDKVYIGETVKWREKMIIAQHRTSSHQLRCEMGRWSVPKGEWENKT